MLLYAQFIPAKIDSWNKPKLFAFCSVQRYVNCMRLINGQIGKSLKPITHAEAIQENSLAYLYVGEKGNENGFADDLVNTSDNSITDIWDGKHIEIKLVERCEDERYHINKVYS